MLSKNNTKFVKSLQLKKYRQKEQLFLVEGEKNVVELLHSAYKVHSLYCSNKFATKYGQIIQNNAIDAIELSEKELERIGTFKTNDAALAIVHEAQTPAINTNHFLLALDDIRDPGNLGTIIRIADWYGIEQLICSETTAEFYNPKVISASMGSVFRIDLIRTDLKDFLSSYPHASYGAFLEGENVHGIDFPDRGVLIIGNESHGIGADVGKLIKHKVTIPKRGKAESLNAAMATAIICDNVFRRV